MSIGTRIKQRREELRLSQRGLSALTGISQAQISRYEKDDTEPTANSIIKLVEALDVSPDWLLGLIDGSEEENRLNSIEEQVIQILRAKPRNRQQNILEIVRLL